MTTLAPILLFVYNRPAHTRQAVESLLRNTLAEQSPLIVYADAARTDADREAVEETRALVRDISGFASVTLVERKENWGLARNIIDGVTTQVARYGRVIVLEDDLVVAPHFLRFMNDALEAYKDEPRVGHIQACDFTGDASLPDTFLIKWTGSWGWATWERAWRHFNPDGAALLGELERRGLTREFDFGGCYPFTRMLRRQVRGENNSWAIRWNASLFLADILSLNVGRSLVQNNGFDGSGTHCGSDRLYQSTLWTQPLPVERILPAEENRQARAAFARYYHRTNCFRAKLIRRIRRILKSWFTTKGTE